MFADADPIGTSVRRIAELLRLLGSENDSRATACFQSDNDLLFQSGNDLPAKWTAFGIRSPLSYDL